MTITLVGSSRELRHKRFLPPIDLLDLIAEDDASSAVPPTDLPKLDPRDMHLCQHKTFRKRKSTVGNSRIEVPASPRSIATGEGFAEDLSPFLALLRNREGIGRGVGKSAGAVMAAGASVVKSPKGKEPNISITETEISADDDGDGGDGVFDKNAFTASTKTDTCQEPLLAAPEAVPEGPETTLTATNMVRNSAATAANGGGGRGSYPGRRPPPPMQSRGVPCYARGTSAATCGVCRRKSRGRASGLPTSAGGADPMLRLCPSLHARISDLRRDNTAAAHFLTKAQAAAWQRSRGAVGTLVSRNRAMCALEGAHLYSLRRQEAVVRKQRRREANRERRRRVEQHRSAMAIATLAKLEGPSLAEIQAREQAELLEKRQRFFIMAVVAVNSATRWRTMWKERKWKMARFAEAMGGGWGAKGDRSGGGGNAQGEEVLTDTFVRGLIQCQRAVRRRLLRNNADHGGIGVPGKHGHGNHNGRGETVIVNKIRRLKRWIIVVTERWRRQRRNGGTVILEFLREARLTQNIKAIYRFRRRVMRCQLYTKGFFSVTRARLRLLGLFHRRCEDRLRGRLAERIRQQVINEAAVDVEVHRQMRPADAGSRVRGAHVRNRADNDGASELLGTVAKLRLGSALEELTARSVHPAIRRRLLEALLVKVRGMHQAHLQLSYERTRNEDRDEEDGFDERSAAFVAEVVITVEDARDMLAGTVPGTPPEADGSIVSGHGVGGEEVSQVTGGGGGSLLSSSAAGPSQQSNKSKQKVVPLLLLRAVPEAAMCQLVLAGWEETLAGGTGVAGGDGGHSSTSSST